LSPQLADLVNVSAAPDALDLLTNRQLRGLLEACARDDYVCATPEIAHLIAHQAHTAGTLAGAWDAFREATRAAYDLNDGARHWSEFFDRRDLGSHPAVSAVEIKFGLADDAWALITNGPPWLRDGRPRPDPLAAAGEETVSFPAVGWGSSQPRPDGRGGSADQRRAHLP
jgi:hypothetical protein